jgi:hypothetical protein
MSKGYKIRRSKNLYKKKKSIPRKILETAVLIIVVVGLGFVGFTVGDAILNYVPPPDEPAPTHTNAEGNEDEPNRDSNAEPPDNEPNDHPDPVAVSGNAVYAPSNVLASSAALSSYLETAKSGGFDSIVIEMKDEEGRLLYQSDIEMVLAAGEISIGTLTAEQIANAAIAAGLKPIARISTLKDHIASERIIDVSYFGWLDDVPGLGKRWANPFLDGTAAYISEITAELHQAGFDDIIFANTIFPTFRGIDYEILPSHVTDANTRFAGLGDFVNTVADNNPDVNILLEMSLGCFVDGTVVRTAEVLRNLEGRGGSLSENISAIVLIFSRDDFTLSDEESGARRGSTSTERIVKDGLAQVTQHSGDLEIVPLLDRDGLSENDCNKISEVFSDNGLENFIIRN